VPVNPGATSGICCSEVAAENSGSNHRELQEISNMQEAGSEPAMGATPGVDSVPGADPEAASLRSKHPVTTTDPGVAPLPAGSPVRAVLERERSSDGHASPHQDLLVSSVHMINCSLPSLGVLGEQSESSVEASRSSTTSPIPIVSMPPRPTIRHQHGITKLKVYTNGTIRYSMLAASDEPRDLHDVLNSPEWKQEMDTEFDALQKYRTWHLVPPKSGSNVINCKWVYKVKRKADGSIDRYKARLVAKGFK
jgi:hypothetical protein